LENRDSFDRLLLCALTFILIFLVPLQSRASDTGLSGFNVLNVHPSADGSGIFSLYGTQTLGHLKPAVRFTLQGVGNLIEAQNPVNSSRSQVVGAAIEGDISSALGLGDHFNIGFTLPLILYEDGMNVNTQNRFKGAGVGDATIDAKVRALKDAAGSVGIGVLARLSLPTGDPGRFTGWYSPTGEFRLIADKSFSALYVVANAGYRIAEKTQVVNRANGASWNVADDDRLTFGLGVQYTLPVQKKTWDLFASVDGDTVVKNVREVTTPIHVLGGIQKRFSNGVSVQIGGGRGVTDALGSPSYRAFASIAFDAGRRWREAHREKAAKVAEELHELIFFDFDDAKLSDAAVAAVDRIAEAMVDDEKLKAAVRGHTDSTGSQSYNEKLGQRRAEAVAGSIVEHGVERSRIDVQSLGASQPADTNVTPEGRARNRRVEINIAP